MSKRLTPVEAAFYEWFHDSKKSGILLDSYRTAFLAGWEAAKQQSPLEVETVSRVYRVTERFPDGSTTVTYLDYP